MLRVLTHFRENSLHSHKELKLPKYSHRNEVPGPEDIKELPKICLNMTTKKALEGSVTVHGSEDFYSPLFFTLE